MSLEERPITNLDIPISQTYSYSEKHTHIPIDHADEICPSEDLNEEDEAASKSLLRKIDCWIMPMLTIMYLFASMDRSDIGNAQVAGMQKAVNASDDQWAKVVSLFYVGYVFAEPVGTLSLRKLTPPVVIGFAVVLWGVMIMCLTAVKNVGQAIGLRILIGVGEGIVHAAPAYLSLWYSPRELATRGSIYYAMSSLAGAFNGLIAYGIVKDLGNTPPFAAWQWIFVVEGSMAIGFGVLVFLLLPPAPENLRWGFTPAEKRMALVRTKRANNTPHATIRWKQVYGFWNQPMFYAWAILLCCNQVALTGVSNFLPAIVEGMGYTSVQAQLMTVPVYAISCVCTIFFGWLSDRTRKRGPWLIFLSCISVIGFVMLLAVKDNQAARYAGVCIAAAGQYSMTTILVTWLAVNLRAWTHRASMYAFINMLAQAVSLGALEAFNTPPRYTKGNAVVLGMVCLSPFISALGIWYCRQQNKKKVARQQDADYELLRQKSFEELGSAHPDFFYSI